MLGNTLNPSSTMAQKMCDTLSQEISAHSAFSIEQPSPNQLVGPTVRRNAFECSSVKLPIKSATPPMSSLLLPFSRLEECPMRRTRPRRLTLCLDRIRRIIGAIRTMSCLGRWNSSWSGSGSRDRNSWWSKLSISTVRLMKLVVDVVFGITIPKLKLIATIVSVASLLTCLHQLRAENNTLEDQVKDLMARRDHLLAVNARLAIPLVPPGKSLNSELGNEIFLFKWQHQLSSLIARKDACKYYIFSCSCSYVHFIRHTTYEFLLPSHSFTIKVVADTTLSQFFAALSPLSPSMIYGGIVYQITQWRPQRVIFSPIHDSPHCNSNKDEVEYGESAWRNKRLVTTSLSCPLPTGGYKIACCNVNFTTFQERRKLIWMNLVELQLNKSRTEGK